MSRCWSRRSCFQCLFATGNLFICAAFRNPAVFNIHMLVILKQKFILQIMYYDNSKFCRRKKFQPLSTWDNFFQVLAEIRPYLAGTGGGILELEEINDYVVKVRLSGPAAGVMTVRVALTQKLREKIPAIAAVQLIEWYILRKYSYIL